METLRTEPNLSAPESTPEKRPPAQKAYDSQYKQILIPAGLGPDQALVYEILLKSGPLKAGKISQKSGIKRGLTYKILDELVDLGLIIKNEEPKIAIFEPAHPMKLREIAENQETKVKTAQAALEGAMAQLTSDYNLGVSKPGVQFYEGKDGIIRIYEALLAQSKKIDSFEDKGEMAAFIPEYVPEFIKKRIRLKIRNRVIAPSNNPVNTSSEKELRETKFIPADLFPFTMDIKISDKLVSIITFQKNHPVGILIDNQEIASNFGKLFNLVWALSKNNIDQNDKPKPLLQEKQ